MLSTGMQYGHFFLVVLIIRGIKPRQLIDLTIDFGGKSFNNIDFLTIVLDDRSILMRFSESLLDFHWLDYNY